MGRVRRVAVRRGPDESRPDTGETPLQLLLVSTPKENPCWKEA